MKSIKSVFIIISLVIFGHTNSQSLSKRVLFLGNSYTYVNDLPQMVSDMATSAGNSLYFDSNTPGGYTLQDHSNNATSLSKIAAGNWDFVVLQEQSQLPSFPLDQVTTEVFPYARFLDSFINVKNTCAETVFYMTWGRKNGDASNCPFWPPVCTYAGMDSLLSLRYRMMADSNQAVLSPAGAVWKYLRQNNPLMELYQADESHPSTAGTYAAACCMYTVLFRKDPTQLTFNASLAAADANTIKAAVKAVVYNQLSNWNIGKYDPKAQFTINNTGGGNFQFTNNSTNATSYSWDFGDSTTSSIQNPSHTYTKTGTYIVKLLVNNCGRTDSISKNIIIQLQGISMQKKSSAQLVIYPNPSKNNINVTVAPQDKIMPFEIYDYSGRIVLSGTMSSGDNNIELDQFADGIYLLNIGGQTNESYRIIKDSSRD